MRVTVYRWYPSIYNIASELEIFNPLYDKNVFFMESDLFIRLPYFFSELIEYMQAWLYTVTKNPFVPHLSTMPWYNTDDTERFQENIVQNGGLEYAGT